MDGIFLHVFLIINFSFRSLLFVMFYQFVCLMLSLFLFLHPVQCSIHSHIYQFFLSFSFQFPFFCTHFLNSSIHQSRRPLAHHIIHSSKSFPFLFKERNPLARLPKCFPHLLLFPISSYTKNAITTFPPNCDKLELARKSHPTNKPVQITFIAQQS